MNHKHSDNLADFYTNILNDIFGTTVVNQTSAVGRHKDPTDFTDSPNAIMRFDEDNLDSPEFDIVGNSNSFTDIIIATGKAGFLPEDVNVDIEGSVLTVSTNLENVKEPSISTVKAEDPYKASAQTKPAPPDKDPIVVFYKGIGKTPENFKLVFNINEKKVNTAEIFAFTTENNTVTIRLPYFAKGHEVSSRRRIEIE